MGRGAMTELPSSFMNLEGDRVVSFLRDAQGLVSFHILTKFQPLEFEGLQPVYWRKIYRSEAYATPDAAFDAALGQFQWVDAAWRGSLQI